MRYQLKLLALFLTVLFLALLLPWHLSGSPRLLAQEPPIPQKTIAKDSDSHTRKESSPAPNEGQKKCTDANLAASAKVFALGTKGKFRVINDGKLAQEGTLWSASAVALVLKDSQSKVIVDFQSAVSIQALVVQGDNNDQYIMEGSNDGVVYQPLWTVPETYVGQGLRTRYVKLKDPMTIRYLRVKGHGGDGFYSLSELRAYCKIPKAWPPKVIAPPKKHGWGAIDNPLMVLIKGWLAVIGSLILLSYPLLSWLKKPLLFRRTRDVALATAGFIAFISWWNIGHFHFDHYVHIWEHYHYYIGAKYSPELRYSRLYECTAAADLEDGLYSRVKDRKMRDLTTNALGTTQDIVKDPTRCTRYFSPSRWKEFKSDIRYFRRRFSVDRWNKSQNDHGYNATPVWGIAARILTDLSDISWKTTLNLEMFDYRKVIDKIFGLAVIDSVILIIMWGVVWWAFGWRAMCAALLYWGCNFPARYYWNGGAFLRYDWLVWMVIGICLLKKEKMASGGFALTYAALLRIFPGMVVVGMIAKAFYHMVEKQKIYISMAQARFAVGCIIALLIFIPMSSWATNGLDAWIEFAQNSNKHLSTPLTNNMGLKTILGYDFATRAVLTRDNSLEDPFARWKAARRHYYATRKPLYIALIVVFLILLGKAGSKGKDWEAAALGAGLIAIGAELTCYFYGFLLTYGLLWYKRKLPGIAACILAAVTCLFPEIWGWNDDHFAAMSLATVITVYGVTSAIALEGTNWRLLISRLKAIPFFKQFGGDKPTR